MVAGIAYVLAGVLGVLAALHAYWLAGGTWGLAAALGRDAVETTPGVRAGAAIVALLLTLAAFGVLARVGVWTAPLPWRVVSVGTWALVAALVLVAVANATARTSLERFGFAPLALVLACLAVAVARAERPE